MEQIIITLNDEEKSYDIETNLDKAELSQHLMKIGIQMYKQAAQEENEQEEEG